MVKRICIRVLLPALFGGILIFGPVFLLVLLYISLVIALLGHLCFPHVMDDLTRA